MLENLKSEKVALHIDVDDEVELAVVLREDGKYDLTWTDYVINVWTETYENLSEAMLRAAALVKCKERGWEAFVQAPEEFTKVAESFFDRTVTKSRKETK